MLELIGDLNHFSLANLEQDAKLLVCVSYLDAGNVLRKQIGVVRYNSEEQLGIISGNREIIFSWRKGSTNSLETVRRVSLNEVAAVLQQTYALDPSKAYQTPPWATVIE